jgi:hypothetical protein
MAARRNRRARHALPAAGGNVRDDPWQAGADCRAFPHGKIRIRRGGAEKAEERGAPSLSGWFPLLSSVFRLPERTSKRARGAGAHSCAPPPAPPPLTRANAAARVEWAWRLHQHQCRQAALVADDRLPFPTNVTGTEIFAEDFGCRVHRPPGSNPCVAPLVRTPAEADRLRVPDLSTSSLAYLFAIADELRRRGGPDCLMKPVDTQTPMDIAARPEPVQRITPAGPFGERDREIRAAREHGAGGIGIVGHVQQGGMDAFAAGHGFASLARCRSAGGFDFAGCRPDSQGFPGDAAAVPRRGQGPRRRGRLLTRSASRRSSPRAGPGSGPAPAPGPWAGAIRPGRRWSRRPMASRP